MGKNRQIKKDNKPKELKRIESGISWSKTDEANLEKAVTDFNKKLDKLQEMELNVHLPEEASFSELRGRIKTRRELNRQLSNLRAFQDENAQEVFVTQSGLEITKWEKDIIEQAGRSVIARRSNDLKAIENKSFMGSESYDQAVSSKEKAQNLLKNLNLANLGDTRDYVKTTGTSDFNYRKAENYRKTYMKEVLPQFKDLEGYEEFKEKLESMSNPTEFYYFLSKDENLKDINQYYPENKNILFGGDSREGTFSKSLKNLGIKVKK